MARQTTTGRVRSLLSVPAAPTVITAPIPA